MKIAFFLCFLGVVGLSLAGTTAHSRGCIYALGRCVRECEEGTHAYTTGCSPKTPEATCDTPEPTPEPGLVCDYSACYCDPPTVRDPATNTCVPLDKCTVKA